MPMHGAYMYMYSSHVLQVGGRVGNTNPHAYDQIRNCCKSPTMYCLMRSNNLYSGTQAGIEPTTFGVLAHCSNH